MIRKFTRRFTFFNDTRGVALVEFAMISPILMMLTIGIMDVGRALHALNTIEHAAKSAARYASVHGTASPNPATEAEIVSLVKNDSIGLDNARMSVQVTWAPDNSPGSFVAVDITYNFNSMLVGVFSSDHMNFSSGSTLLISH